MAEAAQIHVVAGVLSNVDGRVLLAQRLPGSHMAGRWEFPGGKLERGEQPLHGLGRELREELGIELGAARPLIRLRHDYSDRCILLDVWRVTDYQGTPHGLDGQALDWVAPDSLPGVSLLDADWPIATALRLPGVARAVTGSRELESCAAHGEPQTLLWTPASNEATAATERDAVFAARASGHRVIVVGEGVTAAMTAAATGADGVLLARAGEPLTVDARGAFLVGVLCESMDAASRAASQGAHFVIVAHPSAGAALDDSLEDLCRRAGVPAYLGWFRDAPPLEQLRARGIFGCAVRTADPGLAAI